MHPRHARLLSAHCQFSSNAWIWKSPAGVGGFNGVQVFSSTANFTVPSGISKVKATVIGGGGGGDWGPGGHGQITYGVLSVASGQVIPCSVGSGGGAGAGGGTSSFGALTAIGGGPSWAGGYGTAVGANYDYGGGGGFYGAGNNGACIVEW